MGQREFDMEVTDERAYIIMETLSRLYADQMGLEIEKMEFRYPDGTLLKPPATADLRSIGVKNKSKSVV